MEFPDMFGTEIVGQIHVAVVQQALSNAQVLALVAMQHGDLAEVESVEEVQWQAEDEQGNSNIPGWYSFFPVCRRQMHVTQKDKRHSPQSVRGPEQSQEREDIHDRIKKRNQTQRQQNHSKQGSATQSILELRSAGKEAKTHP